MTQTNTIQNKEELETLRSMVNQLNELESLQDELLDQIGAVEKAQEKELSQAHQSGIEEERKRREYIGKDHYVLTFYKDKQGTLCLHEMGNGIDLRDTMSMHALGLQFANSVLLEDGEKQSFAHFCKAYLKSLKENTKASKG